jgi:hypothetical protein
MHKRVNTFMTDEQVPRSGLREPMPIHSEIIDELDRIREVRKAGDSRDAELLTYEHPSGDLKEN